MKMLRKTLCAMTLGVATLAPVISTTVFAAPVAASEQQATANLVVCRQISNKPQKQLLQPKRLRKKA